ncbi:MAG: hypothetical protein AAGI38_05630 [Bacteroidota bacterium]
MKFHLFLLIFCLGFGCSAQSDRKTAEQGNNPQENREVSNALDSTKNEPSIIRLQTWSLVEKGETYESTKRKINVLRNQVRSQNLPIDSIDKVFKESLLNRIIPFWEGTRWSFEGHTSTPRVGEIACGYFVSTTLRDVGLNLNRYRLAQQSPIYEAKSLAIHTEVIEVSEESTADNIQAINTSLTEGIHFIGFDESHVGFVLKEEEDLYLIHANYMDSVGVGIEKIEASEVFTWYSRFYLVELSTNKALLTHWIEGNEIKVVQE